ncbi:MAG: TlpA disulfide reductase family protein [Bacteroidota bacterium]|nr:TlpA disulfide reductase family protein [Bacteroidota bacterium]
MKKAIVLLISVVLLSSAFAQKTLPAKGKVLQKTAVARDNAEHEGLSITGKIEGFTEGKIYLNKLIYPNSIKIDSFDLTNGNFSFTKDISNTNVYSINFGKRHSGVIIFPESENIRVNVKLNNGIIDNADVKSGTLQQVFQEYSKTIKDAGLEMNKLYLAFLNAKKANNESETTRLEKELSVKSAAMDATEAKIQELNVSNLLGIFLITKKIYAYDYDKLKSCLGKVNPVAQKSEIFKTLTARLAKLDNVKVGAIAPDFTLPTPEGDMVSLSQFRGKVVLVDCWASWCGPCRVESPNMVALWNENKDKNFTILGVSLDRPNDREKWIKAIADDKLSWTQVSDLKYWQSKICDLYVINAIPETILIDKDGKIVARGLRGEELKVKVAELLK